MTPLDRKALGTLAKGKKLNLGGPAPRCPLCHAWMEKEFRASAQVFVFVCKTPGSCGILIRVDDSFVGRWEEVLNRPDTEPIVCPRPGCETKMRYFARADGLMKAFCPAAKCGATITNMEPDRPKGDYVTPEEPGVLQ